MIHIILIFAMAGISAVLSIIWLGLAFNYNFSNMQMFDILFLVWFLISGFMIVRFCKAYKYFYLASNYIPFTCAVLFLFRYNLTIIYFYQIVLPYFVMILFIICVEKFRERR
jgi:hypothetical protein